MFRTLFLCAMLTLIVGCVGSHLPLPLVPVAYVVAPFVAAAEAIDANLPGLSNTNFHLRGHIVDDQQTPLNDVEVSITIWRATHRFLGTPDQWRRHTEIRKLSSPFDLVFHNCQIVDLRLTKAEYYNQRAVFLSGMPPHFLDILESTDCDCSNPPAVTVEQLDRGGTIYTASSGQGIRDRNLQITLPVRSSLVPITRYDASLTFAPMQNHILVDLDRPPESAGVMLKKDEPPPSASCISLLPERIDDGRITFSKPYSFDRSVERPLGPRLVTSDPNGGFIPVALGRPGENRFPFFRNAPAEGYQRELMLVDYINERAQHGRLYLAKEGQVWFFFKISDKYGLGVVNPIQGSHLAISATVTLYCQTDGSCNLAALSPNDPAPQPSAPTANEIDDGISGAKP